MTLINHPVSREDKQRPQQERDEVRQAEQPHKRRLSHSSIASSAAPLLTPPLLSTSMEMTASISSAPSARRTRAVFSAIVLDGNLHRGSNISRRRSVLGHLPESCCRVPPLLRACDQEDQQRET
ncbi:hypothetical protein E2C01_017775 [Portunus trituberculatus]|uniref:Uncharacterized protein n=1 Tax=Portunus trituberculatus TaxID=210409 RepID=A0A5B7DUF8_PORTR|nr:hypothetical protein [Portunus trituberculatus]